jgi:small multidrug resistance pump
MAPQARDRHFSKEVLDMNPFLTLGLAIGAEVTATLALKAADGLTRPVPTIIVVLGYGTALWLMSTSMDMLPIGVVYAIWAGIGMVGAALGGVWLYGEPLNTTLLVGIAVVAAGVTILAVGQGQH